MVDLSEYRDGGWFMAIPEPYEPEDPSLPEHGRPREVCSNVNWLRWCSRQGTLDAKRFAGRMLTLARSSPWVREKMTPAAPTEVGRQIEPPVSVESACVERLLDAFEKWQRSKSNGDFEGLFTRGLVALGVSKDDAKNLFGAENQRVKRQKG